VITDRLPTEKDADENGDVFGYSAPGDYAPVPFRSVRLNPKGMFIGWRAIRKSDYFNRIERKEACPFQYERFRS
jgi:hypothetical protein